MKGKIKLILGLTLSLLLVLASCKKETTLQPVQSAMTMVIDNDISLLTKSEKEITFDSGYVYVNKVTFYGELKNDDNTKHGDMDNNDDDKEITQNIDVNSRINLATGDYQVPITFELNQANYDDIKFIIGLNSGNGYPAIEVYGTYYDVNGNPVPVALVYNDSVSIKVKLDDDNDDIDEDLVVADSVPAFVIHVSPAKWFKDVNSDMLENATRVNGVILINDTTNVNILQAILPNIGKESKMEYEDKKDFDREFHQENDD